MRNISRATELRRGHERAQVVLRAVIGASEGAMTFVNPVKRASAAQRQHRRLHVRLAASERRLRLRERGLLLVEFAVWSTPPDFAKPW
jgi:hypothetical protein